jgi:hypothetical protein
MLRKILIIRLAEAQSVVAILEGMLRLALG